MGTKLDFLTHPVQIKVPGGGGIIVPSQIIANCEYVTDYNQIDPTRSDVFVQIQPTFCTPSVNITPSTNTYFKAWTTFATVPDTIPAGSQTATIMGLPDLFPVAPGNPALQPPFGHVDDIKGVVSGLKFTLQIPGIGLDPSTKFCFGSGGAGQSAYVVDEGNVVTVSNATLNFAGVQAVVVFGIQSIVYNLVRLVLGARISGDPIFGTPSYGFKFTMVFRKVTR